MLINKKLHHSLLSANKLPVNSTARVFGLLLDGNWHSSEFIRNKLVGGKRGDGRVRSLRMIKYGGFDVETEYIASLPAVERPKDVRGFRNNTAMTKCCYRLNLDSVTPERMVMLLSAVKEEVKRAESWKSAKLAQ